MRKWFESDMPLDGISIGSVVLDVKSRHQLPKLLAGLQYIFVTPSLHELVFNILEGSISGKSSHTGRKGMSLWEILVMGALRLNLDMDYDTLRDTVNNHNAVRGILGVQTRNVFASHAKHYPLQTIKDNVSLLDEETLKSISIEVVKAGHELKKKKAIKGGPNRYFWN